MKHGCAHVGKLTKLTVGDDLDGLGILHDTGIHHQEAGNVRPVLVKICLCRAGNDGTGDIGAASGEGLHRAVGHTAVEPGDHRVLATGKTAGHNAVGQLGFKIAVLVEEDHLCRVDKGKAQIICHDHAVEVFATAGNVIQGRALGELVVDGLQLCGEIQIQTQAANDAQIALRDLTECLLKGQACRGLVVHLDEKIRHLRVGGEPLAGCGGHHKTAGFLPADDGNSL